MPPTFLIFLGLIVYIGLIIVTLIVFTPMLFIKSKKLFAKKVIATVLISFPCLILMIFSCGIVFIIPAIVFILLKNSNYIPQTIEIILSVIGVLTFVITVVTNSLYLWFFLSRIIYQRLENKPLSDFVDNDKVFKFLRTYLIKHKLNTIAN